MTKFLISACLLVTVLAFIKINVKQISPSTSSLTPMYSSLGSLLIASNSNITPAISNQTDYYWSTEVSIDSVPPICLTSNSPQIDLTVNITGNPGTGIWNGNGIIDMDLGVFDPQNAGVGSHMITYTFTNADTTIIANTTIEILQQPVASFSAQDIICELDTIDINFTGTAGPTTDFQWNFDGGDIISGTGEGPYQIHWDTAGDQLVQLFIVDGVCVSDTFELDIQVDMELDTPNIQCDETFTSISYEWDPIENSLAYVVSVINGPLGMITSDTSYLLPGLSPGQTIGIQMVVVSSNSCPGSITLPVCTTTYCPDSADVIIPLEPLCISSDQSDTLFLTHSIPDSLNDLTVTWAGNGIIDSSMGTLVINDQMIGTNEVFLIMENDICTVYDTMSFEIFPGPVSAFDLPGASCSSDTVDIYFTGTNVSGTILNWDLDNGILLDSSPGNDSLSVTWNTPGLKNVTLTLEHPECSNAVSTQTIEIQSPLANFTMVDSLCLGDTTTVLYNGNADSNASYNWNFFDAIIIGPDTGPGPIQLTWSTAGEHEVSLFVEQEGCISEVASNFINIVAPVPSPVPTCNSTVSSIEIIWENVEAADDYELHSDQNNPIIWTSDTSALVEGLLPSTTLDFTLSTINESVCSNDEIFFSCTTLECEIIDFNWTASDDILCQGESVSLYFNFSSSDTFNLSIFNGNDTTLLFGITDGDSLSISPVANTSYAITSIENPGLPNCIPQALEELNIQVNVPLEAGQATDTLEICSGLDTIFSLQDLISGFQTGGTWTETSANNSMPGSFNGPNGSFQPLNTVPGVYSFLYTLPSPPPCSDDFAEVFILIQEPPIADAGQDLAFSCSFTEGSIGSSLTSNGPNISILWEAASGANIENFDQPIIDITQTDTYYLSVTNTETGCSDSDQVIVSSDISTVNPFTSISPITCAGQNDAVISIDSISGGTAPYLISFNGGPFSNQTIYSNLEPGNYEIFISDTEGCQATMDLEVFSADQLTVNLTGVFAQGEPYIEVGDEIVLTAVINQVLQSIDTIIWTPDTLESPDPISIIDQPFITSTYTVKVIDEAGCIATDFLTVFVQNSGNIFIPNSFSPNDDGINDRLGIYAGKGVEEVLNFSIFNRWGEMVYKQENFQPNDPSVGWDGKFNGQFLNPNVFVYSASIKMINGEVLNLNGEVNLLR